MEIRVSGKNIDLGEVLRHQAEHRLNEVVRKYVDSNFSGHITVSRDGIGFKTECAVRFDHGPVMHVTGEAPDAYQSLSVAIERIAKSLRRFKRKKDKHGADRVPMNGFDTSPPLMIDDHEDDEDDVVATTGAGAVIIAEAVANAPRHSTTSAVEAFEKSDLPVLVFRNAGTGRVNVLYRRKDGHYGWVDIG
ncbi:MAG: ribosome-associated translation inhibitor RaiA [Beijerinckiaceae bacterium]|jgi:ribosomal subunit interface protein|nr:ribosome-associated translation inhibitor RaiA [Beijerinckiaceae bacterium]